MKAELNGVQIAYEERGKGTPLVLLHGFPLHRAMWEPQIAALSGSSRVIAPDLRGHGESEAPPWIYSMDIYADDVRALLDHLAIDKAVICGFSMGGYIALHFYRKYGNRVSGLLLADTRPQPDTPEGKTGRFNTAKKAEKEGAGAIADMMIPKLLSAEGQKRSELVQKVRKIIESTPVRGICGDLAAMAERSDSVPLLSEISVPTLIVVGEQDGLTPPADSKLMAEKIRGAKMEMIPEAGHMSNLEQPERFNKAVEGFLGKG